MIKNVHASYDYIKPISYARFLIPRLLTEDKVLYLDSDLVVDHNLDDLFNTNFGDNLFLAVKDYIFYSDTQMKRQDSLIRAFFCLTIAGLKKVIRI